MTQRSGVQDASSISAGEANQPLARWIRLLVIVGAFLMALGSVLALVQPAMLVGKTDAINGAVHIFAGYFAVRNFVLALMILALLAVSALRALGNFMVLVGFVQLLDVCLDVAEGRWAIAGGVLVFGLLLLVGGARLCGYPFWRIEAWKR
jgi:hypothetical protein